VYLGGDDARRYTDMSDDATLKLADFGFAKLDRGDLVTPVFTPYVNFKFLFLFLWKRLTI
jgi:hypothetical protein